jgi:hypothetical protein
MITIPESEYNAYRAYWFVHLKGAAFCLTYQEYEKAVNMGISQNDIVRLSLDKSFDTVEKAIDFYAK